MRPTPLFVLTLLSALVACDRDETKTERAQGREGRDVAPASVQPQNSPMGTPMPGRQGADADAPKRSAAEDSSKSAGPSAVGQTHAAPADAARETVQAGSREAPYGHDTSTLADERPAGPEPSHGRR